VFGVALFFSSENFVKEIEPLKLTGTGGSELANVLNQEQEEPVMKATEPQNLDLPGFNNLSEEAAAIMDNSDNSSPEKDSLDALLKELGE